MDATDETAWLVEFNNSPPTWWEGRKATHHNWTGHASEAIRFARREDAERMIAWMLDGVGYPTQHAWVPPL